MTKRSSVRLLSFGLLLAGILIIYAITGTVQAAQYRARLESTYRQSLSALAEDLEGIETDLTKSVYANGAATLSDVSRDLSQQANQAKDSLSRLPVEQMNLAGTYKFLSQTGDYATYLSKKVYAGEAVSAKEHENLLRLLQYATKYKNSVTQMVEICNNGGQITKRDVKSADGSRLPAISTDFSTAEEAFENYPTLLYDGPFADAVLHKEPQLLKGQNKISKDAAAKIAAKALGCNETHLNRLEDEAGRMPAYVFTKGQQTVNVTKSGGYVSSILFGGKISTKAIAGLPRYALHLLRRRWQYLHRQFCLLPRRNTLLYRSNQGWRVPTGRQRGIAGGPGLYHQPPPAECAHLYRIGKGSHRQDQPLFGGEEHQKVPDSQGGRPGGSLY